MSGINPQPGPVEPAPAGGVLSYQQESPLLVVKQRENWAQIDQQRFHDEALQWYGEECIVRLLWRAEDAVLGLVEYCTDCQDSPNPANPSSSIQNRVSKVYRQSGNSYCPTCYGTTFVGGFKPIAYHLYMLASDTPEVRSNLSTGQFWQENPRVQMSWYPTIRTGDLVARVQQWNGDVPTSITTRYQVSTVNPVTIRTGPGVTAPAPWTAGVTSNSITVNQVCTLENLWPGHPYYDVPVV